MRWDEYFRKRYNNWLIIHPHFNYQPTHYKGSIYVFTKNKRSNRYRFKLSSL